MSSDNVIILPTKYRERAPANHKQVEATIEREKRARAREELDKKIKTNPKLQTNRTILARRLGVFHHDMKASGRLRGGIGKVFVIAGLADENDTSPSKQLNRYVLPAGKTADEKRLSSTLWNYRELARAFAKVLERDEDKSILEVFQGIFDDDGTGWLAAENHYDYLATLLNTICTGIARKYNLESAFAATTSWALGVDNEGNWAPSLFFCRFNSDNFGLDRWSDEDDVGRLDTMLPSVALYEGTFAIPVRATNNGEAHDNFARAGADFWSHSALVYGTTEISLSITQQIRLAIIPGPSGVPMAALVERFHAALDEVRDLRLQNAGDGWITFRWPCPDGTIETNALRFNEGKMGSEQDGWMHLLLSEVVAGDAAFRLRRLTATALAQTFVAPEAAFEEHLRDLEGTASSASVDQMIADDHVLPSHAPSLTVAARIERDLAFLPVSERPDLLLEQQAKEFCRKLNEYVTSMRVAYEEAAETVLQQWEEARGESEV